MIDLPSQRLPTCTHQPTVFTKKQLLKFVTLFTQQVARSTSMAQTPTQWLVTQSSVSLVAMFHT